MSGNGNGGGSAAAATANAGAAGNRTQGAPAQGGCGLDSGLAKSALLRGRTQSEELSQLQA